MRTTRLFIKKNNTWNELDLYENIKLPITYNVLEIRDISKKSGNYSKTIEIPNTDNNQIIFGNNCDINIYQSNFEMLENYPCFVEVDGLRTFNGFLQLNEVQINDDKEIIYKCVLYSNLIEFVKELGDFTLRGNSDQTKDLDFSNYTTTLTTTWWNNNMGVVNPSATGFGVGLMGKNDWSGRLVASYFDLIFSETTPFLYTKEIFDKIIEKSRYTYISDFLNNTAENNTGFNFKQTTYPNMQINKVGDEDLANLKVEYTGANTNQILGVLNFNSYSSSSIYQNIQQLNHSEKNINTSLTPNFTFDLSYNTSQFSFNKKTKYILRFYFQYAPAHYLQEGDDVWQDVQSSNYFNFYLHLFDLTTNSSLYQITHLQDVLGDSSNPLTFHTNGSNYWVDVEFEVAVENQIVKLIQGNNYGLKADCSFTNRLMGKHGLSTYTLNISHIDLLVDTSGNETQYFELKHYNSFDLDLDFDPTLVLSKESKQVDYIKNIIKKFNLIVEDVSGKYFNGAFQGENVFRIEPYNLYYSKYTTVKDWTKKVNQETIEFKRLDDYINKKLIFTDKYMKDQLTQWYNDYIYNEGSFGQRIVDDNPQITDEDKVETTLTQTANTHYPYKDYLEYCQVIEYDDNNEPNTDKKWGDCLLFVNSVDLETLINEKVRLNQIVGSIKTTHGIYNTFSTFNALFGQDTADLNFGTCKWYYTFLDGNWVTSNNCYNQFYKKMLADYNSAESRIMKCKCLLSAKDMNELLMSDVIIINSTAYHIATIKDWTDGKEEVECEFIKIINSPSSNNGGGAKASQKYPRTQITTKKPNNIVSILKLKNEFSDFRDTTKKMLEELNNRIQKIEESQK